MTIYLDVVLLENLCMNYIILFATGYIMKIKMKQWRLVVSGLLGGVYAVVSYLNILPIYSRLEMKILLSVIIVYLAYHSKGIKQLGKQLVIFYLISFAFGGCAFALLYFIRPQDVLIQNGVYIGTYPIKIALLGGVVGFIITYIAFRVVKTKMKKKDMIYTVTIKVNEKQVTLKAILDTGNLLKEPITGMPVIVVEKQELYSILPATLLNHIDELIGGDQNNFIEEIEEKEYLKKLRIIPFSSIGKQNGLMLGLKADEVIIQKEEEQEKNQNVIIGIFSEQLSKNHSYSALIGLELLERSESSEPITNFKG